MADNRKIERIGNMAPNKVRPGSVKASEFFAAQKEIQKGFEDLAKASGQEAAEYAADIVSQLQEGLMERGILQGTETYSDFMAGAAESFRESYGTEKIDKKQVELLRHVADQLDQAVKRSEISRNFKSSGPKTVSKPASSLPLPPLNVSKSETGKPIDFGTVGSGGPAPTVPSVEVPEILAQETENLKKEEALLKKKEKQGVKASEALAKETSLMGRLEKATTLRKSLLALEERQRKVFEESVADNEVQSRVMFERANGALEELLKHQSDSAEQIVQFSDGEQEVLEEIKDLLKKARVSGVGDLGELKAALENIKGKGSIYSEKNSSFKEVFNRSTSIAERSTEKVSVTNRIREAAGGFITGGVRNIVGGAINKLPLPFRYLLNSASFIPGSMASGEKAAGRLADKASYGRGQIAALEQMMKDTERGSPSMSFGQSNGKPSSYTPPTFAGLGGKKNMRIEQLSVGNFTVDMLNVKELDDESDLYKLLQGKGGGKGALGGLMDTLGNVLTALGGGALLAKGKRLAGAVATGAKGVLSAGSRLAKGAASGLAGGAKLLSKLPGLAKLGGLGLGAGALAAESMLPIGTKVADLGIGAKGLAAGTEAAGIAGAAAKTPGVLSKLGSVAGKAAGAIEVGTAAYDMYDVLSGGTSTEEWNKKNKEMDWLDWLSPWKVGKKVGAETGELANKGISAASGSETSLGSWLYDKLNGNPDSEITKAVPLKASLAADSRASRMSSGQISSPSKLKDLTVESDNVRIAVPDNIAGPAVETANRSAKVLTASRETSSSTSGNVTINNQNNVTTGGGKGGVSDMPIPVAPARNQENAFQRYQLKTFAPF